MNIQDQASFVFYAIAIAFFIIAVVSVITFILSYLRNTELSDQKGWRNFRNPIIGFSIMFAIILSVVVVVLSLLGILNLSFLNL